MARLGVDSDDMVTLFVQVDEDMSGEVSLEELIAGFIRLRNPAKAGERFVAHVDLIFREYDKDNMGSLTKAQFKKFWALDSIQTKLRKYRAFPETDEVWDFCESRGYKDGDLTISELSTG